MGRSPVILFSVFSGEVGEGFGVACKTFAADDLFGVERDKGAAAELFAGVDVGEVHLDGGEPHGFQGVEDGDGGVGVGGGVEDDAVGGAVGALDLRDDVSFAVGLEECDFDAEVCGGAFDAADEGGVIRLAV